jgi:hypothetical protein
MINSEQNLDGKHLRHEPSCTVRHSKKISKTSCICFKALSGSKQKALNEIQDEFTFFKPQASISATNTTATTGQHRRSSNRRSSSTFASSSNGAPTSASNNSNNNKTKSVYIDRNNNTSNNIIGSYRPTSSSQIDVDWYYYNLDRNNYKFKKNKSSSPNISITCEDIEPFNRVDRDDLEVDNSEWLSEKPLSVLQLDAADRAVLKIAGTFLQSNM